MKSVLKLGYGREEGGGGGSAKFIASLFQGYLTFSANLASTVGANGFHSQYICTVKVNRFLVEIHICQQLSGQ